MIFFYNRFIPGIILFQILLITAGNAHGQCPDGQPAGGTVYDTTILIPAGIVAKDVRFPQFDPQAGMVTCVNLCVTIKGIVDTVALQNYSSSSQNASYTYDRTDEVTGPGIISPLTSTANLSFGPFPLTAYDGTPGAGTDFYSRGSDTVLTRVLCANIGDSTTIAQFYGTDSVSYRYDVSASAIGVVPGGSSSTLVLSSALVNFRFQYCTCPATVLPLNVHDFQVRKMQLNGIELSWEGFDDGFADYYYEAEMSRNGKHFQSIGWLPKSHSPGSLYKLNYSPGTWESGTLYFRIKQVYQNGYARYSTIRKAELENSPKAKFSLYPNPSKGIVGIKFDNNLHGRFLIQIFNTNGQLTVAKNLEVSRISSYKEIANLTPGVYWVRAADESGIDSGVSQLLIK